MSILVRRLLVVIGTAGAAVAMSMTPAAASADEHNCAGTIVRSAAGPGFGNLVSDGAHLQLIDNFGQANCGNPPRQNP